VLRGTANRSQRIAIVREKTMKSRNLASNAQNMPAGIRSDMPEEIGKNRPSLAEIHKRALEIHAERGRHFCDLDNYLDEWLQTERELKDKYNTRNTHRTLQALWQAWLQMCQGTRPWPQVLLVRELPECAAANGLCSAEPSCGGQEISRPLSTRSRNLRADLRDQPRTAAPPRGALRAHFQRLDA